MIGKRFLHDRSGTAGAEMALVMPFLMVLVFAGFEAGHFFWSEHKVIEGVRNGVRYASRLPIDKVCPTTDPIVAANIKRVTRTGKLETTAVPLVPGWSNDSQVTITCNTYIATGIYTTYGGNGATVTVAANNLYYPSLLNSLGLLTTSCKLNAWSSAAVIGI